MNDLLSTLPSLQAYLLVAAMLFCIGVWGLINSRNAVRVLMSIELMLNGVNINLMAFSSYVDGDLIRGQVFAGVCDHRCSCRGCRWSWPSCCRFTATELPSIWSSSTCCAGSCSSEAVMRLDRVWVIYRADSPPAQREARHCAKQLEALGAKVVSAMSGPRANPFPRPSGRGGGTAKFGGCLRRRRHCSRCCPSPGCPRHSDSSASMWVVISASSPTTDGVLRGDEVWQRLLDDQFAIERRMMLQAMVDRRCAAERAEGPAVLQQPDVEDDEEHHWALNDFYLRAYRDEISPTCTLELEIDGEVVDQVRGDGLILATPTGSTGYVMAAGGPILHPGIDAIIVTPICPMSLSSRTVVVPPRSRLVLWPLRGCRPSDQALEGWVWDARSCNRESAA